jgi:hypothetical protein
MKNAIMPHGYEIRSKVQAIVARVERDYAARIRTATPAEAALLKKEMKFEIKRQKENLLKELPPGFYPFVMWMW